MRVTTADMKAAVEWLESYEDLGDEDSVDEVAQSIQKVAAWMRNEIITRNTRKVAREHGKPMGEMRALIDDAERRGMI